MSSLPQVSSFAADIDGVIFWITVIVAPWFFLAQGILFYFMFKYRRKAGQPAKYVTGEKKEEKKWIHIPHNLIILCDIVVIVLAVRVWYNVKQELPPADETIRVIGQQWSWRVVHPGLDGQLGTPDDVETVDELHLKVDTTYHYKLESVDVLHSFSVPVFRLKQDAIPGRVITGWFRPTKTGEYDVQCAEMCGIGHGIMKSRVKIESAEEHKAWLMSKANSQAAN